MNQFDLKNRTALITGGAQGFGFDIAKKFLNSGANVIIWDIDEKELQNAVKKINNSKLSYNVVDVSNFEKINQTVLEINKKTNIDILINNAGITMPDNLDNYSLDSWTKTLDVNLTGTFLFSQQVLKRMKKNHSGSIINITSINAEFGFPNNPAYIASKGGLKMLGKSLARDYGKYGIRVNNLGPGYIITKMTEKSYRNKKKYAARKANTMLGRWGKVDDLLGPCIFLASDASSYVTGQDIYVDGGWSANGLQDE